MKIKGRPLVEGEAEGELLVTSQPISFYGGVDPETSRIVEKGHELEGKSLAGKILVFPYGKGSTVGSYILLRLKKKGLAPAAVINRVSEPIIIIGCMISNIPLLDGIDISTLKTGIHAKVVVKRDEAWVELL